ncbi:glutamate receptor 2.7-like [Juglans microcarpa x Juglans regia]|uniref:glutamate receptor 2.7-like n=1 Tax=Juglans microcarpa x Juglans regia TaxID=2249226 RepID=UPI001B7F4443|nr:glutamate receptor 2.7-like [Juglans microcarpa x Juglans regia]
MVGPTYKTNGFGFVFPQGSSLVPHVSRAILNVTQDIDKFGAIEQKYFSSSGSGSTCKDSCPSISSNIASISSNSHSLGLNSFGGLFIITGVVSLFSVLVYALKFLRTKWPTVSTLNPESSFLSKLIEMAKRFDQREDPSSHPNIHERYKSWANTVSSPGDIEFLHNMENHSRNFAAVGDRDESVSSMGSPSRRRQDVPNH